MTTLEVANQLIKYCNDGNWEAAQSELYADHAVSIEMPGSNFPPLTEGKAAIIKKGEMYASMVEEQHNMTIEGPIVGGKYFTCNMINDVTFKGQKRVVNEEVCVYKVEDGKIVSEQFFY